MVNFKNPYQLSVTDLDVNTIDTGNEITEDLDTSTIGQDYINSRAGDYALLLAIGQGKDYRLVNVNINSVGFDWPRMAKIIDFYNTVCRAKVIKVFKETYRHKNAENFDTLPKRAIDTNKILVNFKTYFDDSNYNNSHTLAIPYLHPDLSDTTLVSELMKIKDALGYGTSGTNDTLRDVVLNSKFGKVRV